LKWGLFFDQSRALIATMRLWGRSILLVITKLLSSIYRRSPYR
jgi:hypothetical protein